MTKESGTAMADVANLMLERQRYESWLSSLDARRAATPDAVFLRVRGDYAARLESVTKQLLLHRSSIEQHLGVLTTRLTTLESDALRRREERSEAELRMHVGELSVPDWNAKARECDEAVARISEEQAQVRSQLAQAREILSMVSTQTQAPAPPAPSANGPRPTQPPAPAGGKTGGQANQKVDELEFLNSVVGAQPGERTPQPSPPGPMKPRPPASGNGDGLISRDGAESLGTDPPARKPLSVEPDGAPDLAESLVSRVTQNAGLSNLRENTDAESLLQGTAKGPKPPSAPTAPASPKTAPLAGNVTGNNPIVLKQQGGADRHKTLKCNDCGSMNFPTEWYCERCGAELAAL
jgi:hypothetical protein